MHNTHSIRGNAMFIILIAIVLFAALAFAVTSGRNDLRSAQSQQEAQLSATEMIQFGDAIRVTMDKAIAIHGVSETDPDLFTNFIFNTSTGGIPQVSPPESTCNTSTCPYLFTDQIQVIGVGDGSRTTAMVVLDVTDEICRIMNKLKNNNIPLGQTEDAFTFAAYDGSDASGTALDIDDALFTGQRSFCFKEVSGAERNIFVHILRSR